MSAAVLLLCAGLAAAAEPAEPRPKYGPAGKPVAVTLTNERGHLAFKPAKDFWALVAYYEGMRSDHSASAASVAMVLNALRRRAPLTASDELVTEEALLNKIPAEKWAAKLSGASRPA